jgi:NAD(P)-dependent dehydrogenase (short-subunit alcohol dehydrogenase family)
MTVVVCDAGDSADALDRMDGRLRVLVTVSDARSEGGIEATSEAVFRQLFEANLTSAFRVTRAAFGAMRTGGGGSIIHIASDAGIRADHEAAGYSVASAGVIALSELFAAEGAPHGIRANAVCPRPGTDVAATVAWLASDASRHVSGAVLRVDDAAGAAMTVDTRIA